MARFQWVLVAVCLALVILPFAGQRGIHIRQTEVSYTLVSAGQANQDHDAEPSVAEETTTSAWDYTWQPSYETATLQTIAIVVESSVYPDINASVIQYGEDLRDTGYDTILYTEFIETAEELKALLLTWYDTENLVGAVLIGRLPYAQYYHPSGGGFEAETFICDLYLMDLDGTWRDDSPTDGIYDSHLASSLSDIYPEIFLGRIDPTCLTWGGSEADHINSYLAHVHQYRVGLVERQNRALVYVDDDWAGYFGTLWNADVGNAYPTRTFVQSPLDTNASDWKTNRLVQDYQWTHICVHSSPTLHAFGPDGYGEEGTVTSSEVRAIPPSFSFYNLFACSGARWTSEDNLAVTYTFSGPYSLATIGSSKTGGMLDCGYFYGPLGDDCTLGNSLQQWFSSSLNGAGQAGAEYLQWHYGMNIVGDPLLTIDYDCTVLPPLISSPTHPNQTLWYSDQRPIFEWSVPDDVNNIVGYYYVIDSLPSTCPTESTGTYTDENYTEVGEDLDDETWYLHVVATDSAGNIGTVAAHYQVNVDTTPPELSVVWPVEHYNATTAFLDLEWQVADNVGGYLRTEVWLGSDSNLIYNGSTTSHRIEELSEGTHAINITAIDIAGNRASRQIVMVVDLTRPDVQIFEPVNGAQLGPNLAVAWAADDDCSGYRKSEVRLDGILLFTTWEPRSNITLVGLSWGSHIINVTVFDWAGLSSSSQIQIMVWTPVSQGLIVVGTLVIVFVAVWRYRRAGQ